MPESIRSILVRCRNFIDTTKVPAYPAGADLADEIDVLLAAQPAGAQQPGTAYAALPDADRDYMRKVVAVAVTMLFDSYKEDVMRVFSTGELSEFVTITAAMRVEKVEDIYRRAWDLLSLPARASHGQAPSQAAPAAMHSDLRARCVEVLAWRETGTLPGEALRTLAREKYGDRYDAIQRAERDTETEALNLVAAAPTTQPAPQQEPDEIRSYAAARAWVVMAAQEDKSHDN